MGIYKCIDTTLNRAELKAKQAMRWLRTIVIFTINAAFVKSQMYKLL